MSSSSSSPSSLFKAVIGRRSRRGPPKPPRPSRPTQQGPATTRGQGPKPPHHKNQAQTQKPEARRPVVSSGVPTQTLPGKDPKGSNRPSSDGMSERPARTRPRHRSRGTRTKTQTHTKPSTPKTENPFQGTPFGRRGHRADSACAQQNDRHLSLCGHSALVHAPAGVTVRFPAQSPRQVLTPNRRGRKRNQYGHHVAISCGEGLRKAQVPTRQLEDSENPV